MGEVIHDLFGAVEETTDPESGSLNSTLLGRYAEFMVCAQCCKAGYHATHVDGVGFDFILTTEERPFTVQVKSSNVVIDGWCHWRIGKHTQNGGAGWRGRGYYAKRPLMPTDADLLALFHHVYGTTVFIPIPEHGISHVQLRVVQVQHADIDVSLRNALRCKGVQS